MPEQLGDAPIEEAYRQQMLTLAELLDDYFNRGLKGSARTTGFVLLLFNFGDADGRCNYISNGVNRQDIAKLFREQAARFEAQTDQRSTDERN